MSWFGRRVDALESTMQVLRMTSGDTLICHRNVGGREAKHSDDIACWCVPYEIDPTRVITKSQLRNAMRQEERLQ